MRTALIQLRNRFSLNCSTCLLLMFSLTVFTSTIDAGTTYPFTDDPIDVIIPTTKKDLIVLEHCIRGIKKNCKNIGRVIVVSSERYTDLAEWYDENDYPFSKKDVAYYLCQCDEKATEKFFNKPNSRVGWYYQQLLKLYAAYVIPDLSPNVLVLDSDTVFLNPTNFMNSSDGGLYNVGKEYCKEYFHHMNKLTGGEVRKKYSKYSGITHHMLFQKPVLDDLFNRIEELHQTEFWKAFCLCVDRKDGSGASEYELYFNFVLSMTDQVEIRKLKWKNTRSISSMKKSMKQGYHYISCHSYLRK